jgi:hypothetical protein
MGNWGRGEGEKERILRVKRMEICCIYTCEDRIMKSTKYCLKDRGEGKGKWEYNGRGKLLQSTLHCMHLWNYNNRIPSYY